MSKTAKVIKGGGQTSEGAFLKVLAASVYLIIALLVGIFFTLVWKSWPSIKQFGFHFITGTTWDPVSGEFGGFPFLLGTVITSILALIISFPFSMSIAIFLGEYHKTGWLSDVFKNIVELLAGIPSVIYGFAAIYFLVPIIQNFEINHNIIPYGVSTLTAAIVLAIMIIPYSASVAREVISLTPRDLKEASYSLGATQFETIRKIIIPYTRSGIAAGILLAFGRAIGETMAVTMVIGNTNTLPKDLTTLFFAPSNTMASVIANEFTEATTDIYLSSLIEIALLLFLVTLAFNLLGRFIIKRMGGNV
jgi:phosphate transport system permease protein